MADAFKNREEKEIVAKHYREKIRVLDEQIEALEKERNIYSIRISELAPEKPIARVFLRKDWEVDTYSADWTLVKKTEYVLTNMAKVISTTRDITEYINEKEGGTLSDLDKKEYVSKLGATLVQKTEKGLLFSRVESTSGEFYYGLIDWFYVPGLVKMQYLNPRAKLKTSTNTNSDVMPSSLWLASHIKKID